MGPGTTEATDIPGARCVAFAVDGAGAGTTAVFTALMDVRTGMLEPIEVRGPALDFGLELSDFCTGTGALLTGDGTFFTGVLVGAGATTGFAVDTRLIDKVLLGCEIGAEETDTILLAFTAALFEAAVGANSLLLALFGAVDKVGLADPSDTYVPLKEDLDTGAGANILACGLVYGFQWSREDGSTLLHPVLLKRISNLDRVNSKFDMVPLRNK